MAVTAYLDQVDTDRITARAKEVSFTKTVLRLIAFILFGVGWVVAKTFTYIWFAMVWTALAFQDGWVAARADVNRVREE